MAENIPKDHISRTAVYNLLDTIRFCGVGIDAAIEEIEKLPAVEYTPVKNGEWKHNGNIFECSECEYSFEPEGYLPFFNYCPCCGARMDRGDSNDQM